VLVKLLVALTALVAAAVAGAALASSGAALPPTAGATSVGIKDRASANETVAAERSFVAVAWGASTESGETDVYAAVSRDGGRTFATPVRVNDVEGDARLSGEQPAHVALIPRAGREPSIVVVWTARGPTGTRLLSAQSNDGGASFSRATPVPGSDAAGNRGWEATAVDRAGHVLSVWLDHRELMSTDGAMANMRHDHAHAEPSTKADGAVRAQHSKLYVSSLDGTVAPQAVTGGVCYCCKTALVTGEDGSIFAAWRHVYPGNVRDIVVAFSRDGGRTFGSPVRVSDDGWMIDGCPENGPAMALDSRNRVHIIWPTLAGESSLAMYYTVSIDGARFGRRKLVPTEGTPRHPQLTIASNGSSTAVWDEEENGRRRVVEARLTDGAGDRMQAFRTVLSGTDRGVYPAIAATDGGVVVVWVSGTGTQSVIRVARRP
jgi:hypothetical protein